VDARIHKVLDHVVNLTLRANPIPLWRGIASVRVSTLGPILAAFTILSFCCTRVLVQGLGGSHGEPWDTNLLMDAARWEARHASDEETRAWGVRERERDRHATRRVVRGKGEEATPKSASFRKREVERG
jgi:hypothetical protein